jgi:hypothetical protein
MKSTPVGSQFGAELGSVLASLAELNLRIESVAVAAQSQQAGSRLAADLFAVDSSLRTAHRRLDKVVTGLGR